MHADAIERFGWLSGAVFLEIDDASVAADPNDDVDDLVMEGAQAGRQVGHFTVADNSDHPGRSVVPDLASSIAIAASRSPIS